MDTESYVLLKHLSGRFLRVGLGDLEQRHQLGFLCGVGRDSARMLVGFSTMNVIYINKIVIDKIEFWFCKFRFY